MSQLAFNVLDYGAVGDNATDDTAAIQATINAATATPNRGSGAEVMFPPAKTFLCSSQLNLDTSISLTLRGQAAPEGTGLTSASSTLNFSQDGTPALISARASQGLTLANLRLMNTSAKFTGYFIDLSGNDSDTSGALISRCHLQGSTKATGNAAGGVYLHQAISSKIDGCQFSYMNVGVFGVNLKGYSNAITISNNEFNNLWIHAIQNAGQQWLIQSNTFEACGYGESSGYGAYGPVVFVANWFGDAIKASSWVAYGGNMLSSHGDYFGNPGANMPCILLNGTSQAIQGVSITGSSFEGAYAVGTVGTGHISGFSMTGCHSTGGWINDPGNLLLKPSWFGNDTLVNQVATPLRLPDVALLGPIAALPGSVSYASIGTIEPGVPGGQNGELGLISRGDGGGGDHGIAIFAGDSTQVPIARFQRNAGITAFRPIVLTPTTSAALNSLYVDSSNGNALTFIDAKGVKHILVMP